MQKTLKRIKRILKLHVLMVIKEKRRSTSCLQKGEFVLKFILLVLVAFEPASCYTSLKYCVGICLFPMFYFRSHANW